LSGPRDKSKTTLRSPPEGSASYLMEARKVYVDLERDRRRGASSVMEKRGAAALWAMISLGEAKTPQEKSEQ